MKKFKKTQHTIGIILIGILVQIMLPNPVSGAVLSDEEREIVADVQAQIPLSIQLTEEAIAVISNGWDGMNTEQQAEFQNIFDPGDTGEIDDAYLRDVVANYEKILAKLNGEMRIEYVTDSKKCTGMRLFYTDFINIYVCPYYREEHSPERKAQVLIHEVAHQALLVVDRPYYDPKSYSARYHALTPEGSSLTEIPVLGHIIREIQHTDTLYHPATYAWFATELTK